MDMLSELLTLGEASPPVIFGYHSQKGQVMQSIDASFPKQAVEQAIELLRYNDAHVTSL